MAIAGSDEWIVMPALDAYPGNSPPDDTMRAADIAKCRRVCAQRGFGGFVVYRGVCYFRDAPPDELLDMAMQKPGCCLHVRNPGKKRQDLFNADVEPRQLLSPSLQANSRGKTWRQLRARVLQGMPPRLEARAAQLGLLRRLRLDPCRGVEYDEVTCCLGGLFISLDQIRHQLTQQRSELAALESEGKPVAGVPIGEAGKALRSLLAAVERLQNAALKWKELAQGQLLSEESENDDAADAGGTPALATISFDELAEFLEDSLATEDSVARRAQLLASLTRAATEEARGVASEAVPVPVATAPAPAPVAALSPAPAAEPQAPAAEPQAAPAGGPPLTPPPQSQPVAPESPAPESPAPEEALQLTSPPPPAREQDTGLLSFTPPPRRVVQELAQQNAAREVSTAAGFLAAAAEAPVSLTRAGIAPMKVLRELLDQQEQPAVAAATLRSASTARRALGCVHTAAGAEVRALRDTPSLGRLEEDDGVASMRAEAQSLAAQLEGRCLAAEGGGESGLVVGATYSAVARLRLCLDEAWDGPALCEVPEGALCRVLAHGCKGGTLVLFDGDACHVGAVGWANCRPEGRGALLTRDWRCEEFYLRPLKAPLANEPKPPSDPKQKGSFAGQLFGGKSTKAWWRCIAGDAG